MNKEQILECFYRPRAPAPNMDRYCEIYEVYLTPVQQQPANFEVPKNQRPMVHNLARDNLSVSNTLSICSAFSRISIDRSVYVDIIGNRKKHDIFLTLEQEDPDDRKWHYLDEREIIRGPFSARQMNDFFIFDKIGDRAMVKESYKDDDFFPLKLLIKRYYKKITAEMDEAKRRKPDLKNRTKLFKKGEYVVPKKKMYENYQNPGRMGRVLTHEVRPVDLGFLEGAIEDPDLLAALEPRRERADTDPVALKFRKSNVETI